MKTLNKARAFAVATALLALGATSVAQAQWTNLTRLGTGDAVCAGGVNTPADLQAWFAGNRSAVQKMLSDAGMGENTDQLMGKVASGNFSPTVITTGTEMQWMGRRKQGVPTVKNNIRYMGDKGEPAVALQLEQGCEVHDIVIPLTCCNVALLTTTSKPAPDAPSLNVTPPASCDGGVANVSAGASDGSNVELTLIGPDGNEINILPGDVNLAGAGDYQIRASAVNSCGARSARRSVARFNVESCPEPQPVAVTPAPEPTPAPAPTPTPAAPAPAPEPAKPMAKPARALIPFLAGVIGAQSRTRDLCYCIKDQDEGLIGGRGGVMVPLSDRVSAFGQVGALANTEDSKYGTIHADIGLEAKVGAKGFIGGGVGLWDINNSLYRDPTVFLHGGVDTPWKFGEGTVQWFIEGRKWIDENWEDSGYDDDYSALTGLRVMYR